MAEKKYYPLTSPQLSIWYTEKMYPGTSISNVAGTLRVEDSLDYQTLNQSINLLLKNNDGLRLRIVLDEQGMPRQYISAYQDQKIEFLDFSKSKDPLTDLYNWDRETTSTPLQLIDHDLYRFYIIKVGNRDCGFYILGHHMIMDAWSINLCVSEILHYYYSLVRGIEPKVSKPSYTDFIRTEEEYFGSSRCVRDQSFWSSKFEEKPELTILKSNKDNIFSTASRRKSFRLPKKFINKLNSYCTEHRASKYQLFVAGLAAYIYRVTSQKNIFIGTPLLNRTSPNEKKMLGMFINTVPLRLQANDDINFDTFVQQISTDCLSGMKHQRYPLERIIKEVREKHKTKENLFDIVLSYQNSKLVVNEDVKYFSRWHFNGYQSNSLSIHINERDDDGDLIIDYDYHDHLYFDKEIEFIHSHMLSLLWHALDNPTKRISQLDMISEHEKYKILNDFNNTKADYDKEATIHRMFEEQVEKTPERIALQFMDQSMTYQEVNDKANILAWSLLQRGVTPDMPVGIMAFRSLEMVIGILAILKSGGAYMPIDPNTPEERLNYLVKNSGIKMIITTLEGCKEINGAQVLNISTVLQESHSTKNLPVTSHSSNLAYIIYTSGSTGQPKGVMIEHKAAVNRINWMQKAYPINGSDCLVQKTPFTFDVSVWEFFWWFFAGARLAILVPDGEKDPEAILAAIDKYHITTIHFVPSMFKSFLEYVTAKSRWSDLAALRQIFSSGEALPFHVVQEFAKHNIHGIQLINLYGPTEAAVDVTHYNCLSGKYIKSVPIGKPIDNTQIYILDNNLNIQPIGSVGELHIAGVGLARGYLNNPELTSQKFIPNPFSPGQRMYKTGDLARWFPKGDIEYIGRIDHQIKIRGHRVELNEIKLQIMKTKTVRDALVICKEHNNAKHIYAYVILEGDWNEDHIRVSLRKVLPEYMIPSFIIGISEFPLSTNGKIDLKRLPEPRITEKELVNPRTEAEKQIAEVWKDILKKDVVSVHSNFFELGGDSLAAIQLISRLENISLEDVYKYPTIEQLSHRINSNVIDKDSILIPHKNSLGAKGDMALLCFPYGGGSGIIYLDLFNEIDKATDRYHLFSVNLPDRGNNADSVALTDVSERITNQLVDMGIKKVVLYGHCVGSALALDTAARIEKEDIRIISVCLGGILPPKYPRIYGQDFSPWNFFSDTFIINYLKKIGFNDAIPEELMSSMIKAFRYDVKSFYGFFFNACRQNFHLNTSIISIIGDEDPLTKNYKRRYMDWSRLSSNVSLEVIPGARHYFIKTHANVLAQILLNALEGTLHAAI